MQCHHFPYYMAGCCVFGLCLTYTISVSLGHVYFWFPYISDTGAEPPESVIFGLTLNVTTFLFALLLYVRYQLVSLGNDKLGLNLSKLWNKISIILGILSCIGLLIVAYCSELTMPKSHYYGAYTCFSCLILYFMIQTRISYSFLDKPFGITKKVFITRCILNLIMIISYTLMTVFGMKAVTEFTGNKISNWTPEDGGFQNHLVSTFSEWTILLSIAAYVLTFAIELKTIQCDYLIIKLKD